MDYSRRGFTGLMLSLFCGPRCGNSASPDRRPVLTQYRADAVILLLGIPIYKRADVGTGQVSVEAAGKGAEAHRTLFFAAGSDPQRAHGLARLGWMREVRHGQEPTSTETEYFGVLSSSPEESLDSARKSVAAPPHGQSLFAAVNGRHTAGRSSSAVAHFEFPSDASWSDPDLIERSKSAFAPTTVWHETAWPKSPDQPPLTFLFQLEALLQKKAKCAGTYVYNEQEYVLELGAPQEARPLLAIKGSIRNQRTGNRTAFRVWIEDATNSVVPVRIEFQPRSFLRLTFEALPA